MDDLQIYFGNDLVINDKISIAQPTIRDITQMGEERYFSMVFALTAISSDMKSFLWDMGVDWTDLSDFEMFYLMSTTMPKSETCILFGDEIDFTTFTARRRSDGELFMDNPQGIVIDMYIHKRIHDFLCKVHNIQKKPEFAGNKLTKMVMIDDDRQRKKLEKNKEYKSILLPLISAMVNSEGFKYNIETVQDMKLYAFMDCVRRIQVIKSAGHLTDAYYSGNLDTDKFDKTKLDWFCDLNKKRN